MKHLESPMIKLFFFTAVACGFAPSTLAQQSDEQLNPSSMLFQLDDLGSEWRPSLPLPWVSDKVSVLNDYMSNLLSHQQRTFALSNTQRLLTVPKKSEDFNMFSEHKVIEDKRAKMTANTDFLAKNRVHTDIDDDNPQAFTQSSTGLWLAFASHAARPQPLMKWHTLSDENYTRAKSSADFNTLYSLGVSSQIQSQMAYNNLLSLLLERTPQGKNKYSKMERQDFQADFRMRDGNDSWRKAMKNAPTQLLARETLFVLAEMRQELHESRKDNERLLASISMMQAQMTEINMQSMDTLIQKINHTYRYKK